MKKQIIWKYEVKKKRVEAGMRLKQKLCRTWGSDTINKLTASFFY